MAQLKTLSAMLAVAYKPHGISDFPPELQPAIQENFLDAEVQHGLQSSTVFRQVADREIVATKRGETVTKTRTGLKAPKETPSDPSKNTGLDNGMTPSGAKLEQYTLAINQYDDTQDVNIVSSSVGIVEAFLEAGRVNGVQAAQSVDRLARNALYGAYLGGNTRITTTLGAPSTTVAVDDIRGFTWAIQNGMQLPVSMSNGLAAVIGGDVYTVIGVIADPVNVSTAPKGVSGTLMLSTNCSVADGTAGQAVVAAIAPAIKRAGERATTADIVATDKLTLAVVQEAVADLRSNNVPRVNGVGAYVAYASPRQLLGLYRDPEFQMLYRGQFGAEAITSGNVTHMLGVAFVETTEAPQQTLNGVKVHRMVVCGQGAIIEGDYEGTGKRETASQDKGLVTVKDGICHVTRAPIDRLAQTVSLSWYFIGGFAVPTDVTADSTIIPTATSSAYKRAVVIESA